jgi:magnesium-transporting ATPase (P-type)
MGKSVFLRTPLLNVSLSICVFLSVSIPADVLVVSSGMANGTFCFVDTKELDGETNLKPKQVPPPLLTVCKKEKKSFEKLSLSLRTDPPSGVMNSWAGDLTVGSQRENVSLPSLLLTDSVLRNTPWIVGMVVYTGEQTKIRQNMSEQTQSQRQKESSVFRLAKRCFVAMVILQVILCVVAATLSGIAQSHNQSDNSFYLDPSQSALLFGFLRLFTWQLIVKDFIPISLYVSLELVQFFQAWLLSRDLAMVHEVGGEVFAASSQTSKLNEELAQVSVTATDVRYHRLCSLFSCVSSLSLFLSLQLLHLFRQDRHVDEE